MRTVKTLFKQGDWVFVKTHKIAKEVLTVVKVSNKGNLIVYAPNKNGCIIVKTIDNLYCAKKWIPKKHEWCIFWDNSEKEHYHIEKYDKTQERPKAISGVLYDNIAPLEMIRPLLKN